VARAFNGSTDKITLSSAPATAYPMTIAAWVRCRDTTNSQDVVYIGAGVANTTAFRLNMGGATAGDPVRAVNSSSGGATVVAVTSTGYSNNVWCHACAVFSNTNLRAAFINGGSKGTESTANAPGTPDRVGIGFANVGAGSSFITGDVAELAIWSAALTDTEVAAAASGVPPWRIRPASLVSYVPIWALHSPEIDLKTPGNSWTVTGTSLATHAPVSPFSRRLWVPTVPLIEAATGFQAAWAGGANRLISGGVSGG